MAALLGRLDRFVDSLGRGQCRERGAADARHDDCAGGDESVKRLRFDCLAHRAKHAAPDLFERLESLTLRTSTAAEETVDGREVSDLGRFAEAGERELLIQDSV